MPTVFTDMIQNRAAVLAILFLATGALGIPLLWINRKFSSIERVFWAVVVTVCGSSGPPRTNRTVQVPSIARASPATST
jgi:hypothetical protein